MNVFYSWTISICLSAVAASIFELLIPKGNMEKIFRVVLGIFMVCVVLVPINSVLSSVKNNITIQKYQYQDGDYNAYVNEQYINSAKEVLYNKSIETLSDIGLTAEKVDIIIDIDDNNEVVNIWAEVTIPNSEINNIEKIENAVYNNVGIECKVYTEGND